jgi:hypothetical protein
MPPSNDTREGKTVFLGGVAEETTEEGIIEHLSRFGEVKGAVVMKDRRTGRSRGFGFATFCDESALAKATAGSHVIDGKVVEVKISRPQKKTVFVGGLAHSVTDDILADYFKKYGRVVHAVVKLWSPGSGRKSQSPRGFGFITFMKAEAAAAVLLDDTVHELEGKVIEVKTTLDGKTRVNLTDEAKKGDSTRVDKTVAGLDVPPPPEHPPLFANNPTKQNCKYYMHTGLLAPTIRAALSQCGFQLLTGLLPLPTSYINILCTTTLYTSPGVCRFGLCCRFHHPPLLGYGWGYGVCPQAEFMAWAAHNPVPLWIPPSSAAAKEKLASTAAAAEGSLLNNKTSPALSVDVPSFSPSNGGLGTGQQNDQNGHQHPQEM